MKPKVKPKVINPRRITIDGGDPKLIGMNINDAAQYIMSRGYGYVFCKQGETIDLTDCEPERLWTVCIYDENEIVTRIYDEE